MYVHNIAAGFKPGSNNITAGALSAGSKAAPREYNETSVFAFFPLAVVWKRTDAWVVKFWSSGHIWKNLQPNPEAKYVSFRRFCCSPDGSIQHIQKG